MLDASVWLWVGGDPEGAFASKPAPTGGTRFKCGSGLAREDVGQIIIASQAM